MKDWWIACVYVSAFFLPPLGFPFPWKCARGPQTHIVPHGRSRAPLLPFIIKLDGSQFRFSFSILQRMATLAKLRIERPLFLDVRESLSTCLRTCAQAPLTLEHLWHIPILVALLLRFFLCPSRVDRHNYGMKDATPFMSTTNTMP